MPYVVIPHMSVQRANALATLYLVSQAPVIAALMFAHNLGRTTGVFARRVAIIHHDGQLLGDSDIPRDGWVDRSLYPHQFRSAGLVDLDDHVKGVSANNYTSLGSQPSVTMHLEVSLVLEYEDKTPAIDYIHAFLNSARLAGGPVVDYFPARKFDDLKGVRNYLWTGFWLLDNTECLDSVDCGRADALFALCLDRQHTVVGKDQDDNEIVAWRVPAVLGHAAISPKASRWGVRDDESPHMYSEPLVGLVEYRSASKLSEEETSGAFWEGAWIRDDVFVARQPR